jgi:hypothetical protein
MNRPENSGAFRSRLYADREQLNHLLSQMAHLAFQLRFSPEDRSFYVPIILQLSKTVQGMEPNSEVGLLIESGIARMMRYEYSAAAAMMKSAVTLSGSVERYAKPRLDITTSRRSPLHPFLDQSVARPESVH